MFRCIISINPSVYAFISALLLSVATSAATMISFADPVTPVSGSVGWTGTCAFIAGLLWFAQSENVNSLRRRIDILAQASSWDRAVQAQSKNAKLGTIALFVLALLFTIAWPFVRALIDVPAPRVP